MLKAKKKTTKREVSRVKIVDKIDKEMLKSKRIITIDIQEK
jgi:hypothetical protein